MKVLPSPVPTPGPSSQLLELRIRGGAKLQKRVDLATCGWFDGDLYSPAICIEGQKCVRDPTLAAAGCCMSDAGTDCYLLTTCVERAASSTDCRCASDYNVAFCTDIENPYCAAAILPGATRLTRYYCEVVPSQTYTILSTTTSSQSDDSSESATATDTAASPPLVTAPPVDPPVTTPVSQMVSPGTLAAIAVPSMLGIVGLVAIVVTVIWYIIRQKAKKQNEAQPPLLSPWEQNALRDLNTSSTDDAFAKSRKPFREGVIMEMPDMNDADGTDDTDDADDHTNAGSEDSWRPHGA